MSTCVGSRPWHGVNDSSAHARGIDLSWCGGWGNWGWGRMSRPGWVALKHWNDHSLELWVACALRLQELARSRRCMHSSQRRASSLMAWTSSRSTTLCAMHHSQKKMSQKLALGIWKVHSLVISPAAVEWWADSETSYVVTGSTRPAEVARVKFRSWRSRSGKWHWWDGLMGVGCRLRTSAPHRQRIGTRAEFPSRVQKWAAEGQVTYNVYFNGCFCLLSPCQASVHTVSRNNLKLWNLCCGEERGLLSL